MHPESWLIEYLWGTLLLKDSFAQSTPLPCQKFHQKGKRRDPRYDKGEVLSGYMAQVQTCDCTCAKDKSPSLNELTINRQLCFSLLLVHLLISINTNVLVGTGTKFITDSCLSKFWHVWRSCAWCLSTNQGPHEGNRREGEFCHFCRGDKLLLHLCFASLVFSFFKILFIFTIQLFQVEC